MTIRPLEIALIQLCFYLILWISYEYAALLMSVIFGGISLIILIVSIIIEMIEPSKVPKSYFSFMIISAIVPVLTGSGYYFLFG